MTELTELEWNILDNVSDDWECPVTICPEVERDVPGSSRTEIIHTLYELHERGFLELMKGGNVDLAELMNDPPDDFGTRYWFGLTTLGCSIWQSHAEQFGSETVDWSRSWVGHGPDVNGRGYVDGTSREVCLEALDHLIRFAHLTRDEDWEIDRSSLKDSAIDGFQAKYYKYIEGGHRISFKLKSKRARE